MATLPFADRGSRRRNAARFVVEPLEERIALSADGNDSRSTPIQAGTINPGQTITKTGSVGSSGDNLDYYRFTIGGSGAVPLAVSLGGLSADLDVSVETLSGSIVSRGTRSGTSSEAVNVIFSPGSFLIRVFKGVSNAVSNYTLRLTTGISNEPNDDRAHATFLGTLSSSTLTKSGTIGFPSTDTQDYFRFFVSGRHKLSWTLDSLSADLDIQVMNSSGSVFHSGTNNGTANESGISTLAGGTYYIRIFKGVSSAASSYRLRMNLIS